MALQRAAYRNFSATQINNRLSATCDHVVNGTNVDCTNISLNASKGIVGCSTYSLADICKYTGVNHWSAWGPTVRTVAGGVLTNSHLTDVTGYSLGSFGGYNHLAPTPAFTSGGSNTYSLIQSGADQVFSCVLDIGEVLYNDVTGVTNQATHIHFSIWDGASWVTDAAEVIAIADAVDGAGNSNSVIDFSQAGTRITISGITTTNTYTCKIWFCDDGTFDYAGGNKVFEMTEFASWTHEVRIKSANHWFINAAYNDTTYDGDGSFTSGRWDVNGCQIDLSTGLMDMNYLTLNTYLGSAWGDTGYNSLDLNFIIQTGYFDESSVWQGTTVSTSSDYVTNEPWNFTGPTCAISGITDFDIWVPGTAMDNSGYGYRFIINCNVD